jgi:hypothetical protein
MAGTTGLEPATSAVTGQHSNQLNYVPNRLEKPREALHLAFPVICAASLPARTRETVTIPL